MKRTSVRQVSSGLRSRWVGIRSWSVGRRCSTRTVEITKEGFVSSSTSTQENKID